MTEFDMQLARGVDDGFTNLAIGEPYVIQACLDLAPQTLGYGPQQLYPPAAGDQRLIEVVKRRYQDHHVVITNGAKQALYAAVYALQRKYELHRVVTPAPYWPSFPTIAQISGLAFSAAKPGVSMHLSILTRPNNPTGMMETSDVFCHIWDSVYAHQVYGYRDEWQPGYKVKVESASKTFGLSGYRVGWLVTGDGEIAADAAKYVELHTSGVSVPAQTYVAKILEMDSKGVFSGGFQQARSLMIANGQMFMARMEQFIDDVQGVPYNNTGMFSWFQVRPSYHERFVNALETAKVRLVTGVACGVEGDGYWYRMSMGHLPNVTEDALYRLKNKVLYA